MMFLRVSMKLALALLCCGVLSITLLWGRCGELPYRQVLRSGFPVSSSLEKHSYEAAVDIECLINGEYAINCRRENQEVYVPFSFIHKYFEVYGKIMNHEGVERFEWSHSYSKTYKPKRKYDPRGTFTTFENYNVEVRERVKCISGVEGVPVSMQWEPQGYFYPTQIAQFGLAHYSKNLTEPEPRRRVLDDGERQLGAWIVSGDATMSREYDASAASNVLHFGTADHPSSQVWLKVNVSQDFVLSADVWLKANSSLTLVLQHREKKETHYLHYVTGNLMISAQDEHVYYGIGTEQKWKHLTRDLIIDMQKGWALQDKPKRKASRAKFKISSLILSGSGALDNLTVSSSEHEAQFLAAADWFVRSQRADSGGWPIPVRRRIASGFGELSAGWYSAMSQGHAISLLARAYHRTGDPRYLRAAKKALYLFDLPSRLGGVLAHFLDRYAWYEEYPTKPASFVLNGFIYALLGLYDLHVIEGQNAISRAKQMFDEGMKSLKLMLPLYDTGSGSVYDLRHFTLGVSPNIARWDYHATHINQLYLLASLDSDPLLANTARRWEAYMQGKRAAHN